MIGSSGGDSDEAINILSRRALCEVGKVGSAKKYIRGKPDPADRHGIYQKQQIGGITNENNASSNNLWFYM